MECESGITRIVTCYKQWSYIKNWINNTNLFNGDTQWIFINDNPDDPPPNEIISRIDEVGGLLFCNPINFGRCLSRNRGIKSASKKWVDFVDGDDIPLPLHSDQLRDLESADLIYFPVEHYRVGHENEITKEIDDCFVPDEMHILTREVTGNIDCRPAAVLWKLSALEHLGGFDGRAEYNEDLHLVLRAKLAGLKHDYYDSPKCCYQRETEGRTESPIGPVASLNCSNIIRQLNPKSISTLNDYQKNCRYRMLWVAMKELDKEKISFLSKIKEITKWLIRKV